MVHRNTANIHGLQWGRNFIVAEIPDLTLQSLLFEKLQWGRNFIVAEMACWWIAAKVSILVLQWGRNFIVAEMRV